MDYIGLNHFEVFRVGVIWLKQDHCDGENKDYDFLFRAFPAGQQELEMEDLQYIFRSYAWLTGYTRISIKLIHNGYFYHLQRLTYERLLSKYPLVN